MGIIKAFKVFNEAIIGSNKITGGKIFE